MTAVCATKLSDGVWIASDSCAVETQYGIRTTVGPKIVPFKKYVVGYTTSFRTHDLLEQHHDKFPTAITGRKDAIEFVEVFKGVLKDSGVKEKTDSEGTFCVYPANVILATPTEIYEITNELSVYQRADGVHAIGCAANLCLASIATHRRIHPNASSRDLLRLAIFTAAELSAFVSLPCWIYRMDPGRLDHTKDFPNSVEEQP